MQWSFQNGTSVIVIPIAVEVPVFPDLYFHGIDPVYQIRDAKFFFLADVGKLFKRRGSIKDVILCPFSVKLEAVKLFADYSQRTVNIWFPQKLVGNIVKLQMSFTTEFRPVVVF